MQRKIRNITLIIMIPLAITLFTSAKSKYDYPEGWNLAELTLVDGTYQGEAIGFREGLLVEVTVNQGKVTEITIVDHNEIGRRYYQRPMDQIPGEIVEKQHTEVDGVTGATATSMAIMSAVENALEGAQD